VDVIDMVEEFQKELFSKYDLHFIHASDEFYLTAGREVPEESRYDGYMQLENGVGMLRLLKEEFAYALDSICEDKAGGMSYKKNGGSQDKCYVTIATGRLAYDTIRQLTDEAMVRLKEAGVIDDSLELNCVAIRNDFFGERITVSGLICGCDLINQLQGIRPGSRLLLPINMMRSGEKYFLDDVTVAELEEKLQVNVVIVPSDGESLLKGILGEELEIGGRQIYEQADSSDSWQA
jgi:NifB/MoaA-like Fe-S oxidoreductase